MKYLISILIFTFAGATMAQETITPLKEAFQNSREQKNIALVLPALLKSDLYVITAEVEPGKFDYFYTKSPKPDRYCVTVAEDESTLSSVKWPKRKMTGLQLLTELPEAIEIVVTYKDGGDYITREQLQWYRKQLP
jgi:hypothetical protein